MGKYSIGFRMKFDDVEPEDIRRIIIEYLQKFDRYEIKITKHLISSGKIKAVLDASEELANGRYSLHLLKNLLSDEQSYAETIQLINVLQDYKTSDMIYLVTHIPSGDLMEYLGKIIDISTKLPENYILLLENEEKNSDNQQYLRQINRLCYALQRKNILNVGICLDIGHLLFDLHNEGISSEIGLALVSKMQYMLSQVKEIHVHDYNEKSHLQLQKGMMDLGIVSKFIIANSLIVPIIIEATVVRPDEDGVRQVLIMKENLKEH